GGGATGGWDGGASHALMGLPTRPAAPATTISAIEALRRPTLGDVSPSTALMGRYLIRPYGLRIARSFSRLASLIRHIGRRNSGSSMPAIANASLIGMGFGSREADRAIGES